MENPMNEDQLQAKCFRWFDETFPAERKMLFAVPNGGERVSRKINGVWVNEGNKLKHMGVVPGVADMILVTDEVTFIEMKFGSGTQSQEQTKFMDRVRERGHDYRLIYSFEEFQKLIIKKITQYEKRKGTDE